MSKSMTIPTECNDLKAIFGGISEMMMPLGCLIITVLAIACAGRWQSARFNFMAYSQSSFIFDRVFLNIAFSSFFVFLAVPISLLNFSAYFFTVGSLLIFGCNSSTASFTNGIQSAFSTAVQAKFRDGFDYLALRTGLCYDGLKHGFFLIKKLCLGPVTGHILWPAYLIVCNSNQNTSINSIKD